MVDSANTSQSHGSRAGRSTLIKAQFLPLDTTSERGTVDETEDTHQRVHNLRIRLEVKACDQICISVTINLRWELEAHTALPRSCSPHNTILVVAFYQAITVVIRGIISYTSRCSLRPRTVF